MRGVGAIFDAPASHGEFGLRARCAFGASLRERRYTHAYVLPNTWKSALVPLDWLHGETGRLIYDCEPYGFLGGGFCK